MTPRAESLTETMLILLLLVITISYARAAEICCHAWGIGCFTDNYPFGHLPLPSCPDEVQPNFRVYTRTNRNNGELITSTTIPPSFGNWRQTVFIIHGFIQDWVAEWMHDMKNALLDAGDYNVIITGWGGGSQTIDYWWAASNTRVVGAMAERVSSNLIAADGITASSIWCIGHSLGAHTCGHFGKRLRIGRITGMDPAGPSFENYPNEAGLQASDANFVDVIHTAGKDHPIMDYGTLKSMGHADFYPNDGHTQPGCDWTYVDGATPTPEPSPRPGLYPCDHGLAHSYMIESIRSSCRFNARERCTDEWNIPGSCSPCGGVCQVMGAPAAADGRSGKFRLQTNADEPWCRG